MPALSEGTAQESEAVNGQIMDAVVELIKRLASLGQLIGTRYGLSGSEAMALHKLDQPIAMKEFAAKLGCDASFVTMIADSLEGRGMARREPSQRDRRSKNLVLTERGAGMREEITRELTRRMPWSYALDTDERQCFLRILLKMIAAAEAERDAPTASGRKKGAATVTSPRPASS